MELYWEKIQRELQYRASSELFKYPNSAVGKVPELVSKISFGRCTSYNDESERYLFLNYQQWCRILEYGLVEYKKDLKHLRAQSEAVVEDFVALQEELGMRVQDIARRTKMYEGVFKDVMATEDTRPRLEEFLFMHKKIMRQMDDMINNLQTSSSTMKKYRKRLRIQTKAIDIEGSSMKAINMSELKILCEQAMVELKDLDEQIHDLKFVFVRARQKKIFYTLVLSKELNRQRLVQRETTQRNILRGRMDSEIKAVADDRIQQSKLRDKLHEVMLDYKPISVADFIHSYKEGQELSKSMVSHNRRLKLAKNNYLRHKKLWMKLGRQGIH